MVRVKTIVASDDDELFTLTPRAKRLIEKRQFPDWMPWQNRLLACIVLKTGDLGITPKNAVSLANEILDNYDGDHEEAMEAILSDEWEIDLIEGETLQ